MKSAKMKLTKITLLSILAIITFIMGALLMIPKKATAEELAWKESTTAKEYTVTQKSGTVGWLGSATSKTAVGTKVYLTYKVKAATTSGAQWGLIMGKTVVTGYGMYGDTNGKLWHASTAANNLLEVGSTYQIIFSRTGETTLETSVTKTDSGSATSTLSFTSTAGTALSDAGLYGIWFAGSPTGLVLEGFKCYDDSDADLGVQSNYAAGYQIEEEGYVAPVLPAFEWMTAPASIPTNMGIQQEKSITSFLYFGSATPIAQVGDIVYLTYHVTAKDGDAGTQTGIIGTATPTATYPYTVNSKGVMKYTQGSSVMFDKGYTYQIMYQKDSDTTWKTSVSKIDSEGAKTDVTLGSATASTIPAEAKQFGVWFTDGALSGLLLTKVQCYDQNGNDLGIMFNDSVSASFSYTSDYLLPLEWTEAPANVTTYRLIQDEVTTCLFFGNETALTEIGSKVYLSYYVNKADSVSQIQSGVVVTKDTTQSFPYTGGNGYMNFDKPVSIEAGNNYQVIFERTSATEIRYTLTKIPSTGTSVKLSYTQTTGAITAEMGNYGVWNSGGAGSLAGIEIENIQCFDGNGNDLGVVVNSVSFTLSEASATATVKYLNMDGTDTAIPSATKNYLDTITIESASANGYLFWVANGKAYKGGESFKIGADLTLQGVKAELAHEGAYVRASNPTGIRFGTSINIEQYTALTEAVGADNVKLGTIIIPTDYLTAKDANDAANFTFAKLDELEAADSTGKFHYLNVVANGLNDTDDEGNYVYYSAIVNLQAFNYNRAFSARSYLQITLGGTTETIYCDYDASAQSRSVYDLAKASLAVVPAEETEVKAVCKGFIDGVASLSINGGEATFDAIEGYVNPYEASVDGSTLTITASASVDGANIANINIIVIDGVNYYNAEAGTGLANTFTVSGSTITVMVNA